MELKTSKSDAWGYQPWKLAWKDHDDDDDKDMLNDVMCALQLEAMVVLTVPPLASNWIAILDELAHSRNEFMSYVCYTCAKCSFSPLQVATAPQARVFPICRKQIHLSD